MQKIYPKWWLSFLLRGTSFFIQDIKIQNPYFLISNSQFYRNETNSISNYRKNIITWLTLAMTSGKSSPPPNNRNPHGPPPVIWIRSRCVDAAMLLVSSWSCRSKRRIDAEELFAVSPLFPAPLPLLALAHEKQSNQAGAATVYSLVVAI